MKLKIIKAFTWAHRGVELEQFVEGQEIETEDQDMIEVSVSEGWAESEYNPKRKKAANSTLKPSRQRINDIHAI